MTNMNIDMNSEIIIASEMQLNVITILSDVHKCWKSVNDVIYYDSKIYILQNFTLHNAVISQIHDDIFTDHFRKLRTAELMWQFYNWPGTV